MNLNFKIVILYFSFYFLKKFYKPYLDLNNIKLKMKEFLSYLSYLSHLF